MPFHGIDHGAAIFIGLRKKNNDITNVTIEILRNINVSSKVMKVI